MCGARPVRVDRLRGRHPLGRNQAGAVRSAADGTTALRSGTGGRRRLERLTAAHHATASCQLPQVRGELPVEQRAKGVPVGGWRANPLF